MNINNRKLEGKTIAVDMDGVLANINDKWVAAYNAVFNDKLTIEDITSWNLKDVVKSEAKEFIYGFLEMKDFYRDLKVIQDSQRVLEKLSKDNIVIIVSDPFTKMSYQSKYEWLVENFPFIKPTNFVFTGNKSVIKADIMIDDGAHNLNMFDGIKILFDAPYNRNENKFYRVLNWQEIDFKLNYMFEEIEGFVPEITEPPKNIETPITSPVAPQLANPIPQQPVQPTNPVQGQVINQTVTQTEPQVAPLNKPLL